MKFYRSKPSVVRAILYDGENKSEVLKFITKPGEVFMMPFKDEWAVKDNEGNVDILTKKEFTNRYE
jgi:hypothetical protein|tara:strand:- start:2806 stop:3003 length:198 start_codon:yes stop_codon:yes gene_type:complete